MAKIFINYRRDDSAPYAGRLYDRLAGHFGHDQLFMDIDQIEPGEDFVEVIQEKLKAVQVAVVLIGKHWLDIADANGQRRLDNPDDWVRLEIVTLLERKIRVIPILVGRANAPNSSQLPECLESLARRQAHEISDQRFHSDVDKLIQVLEKALSAKATLVSPGASRFEQPDETRLLFEPEMVRIPPGTFLITAGNVWEWTQDCWHENYSGAPADGSAWLEKGDGDCHRRVVRGGSWLSIPQFLRSVDRVQILTGDAGNFLGFRIARAF